MKTVALTLAFLAMAAVTIWSLVFRTPPPSPAPADVIEAQAVPPSELTQASSLATVPPPVPAAAELEVTFLSEMQACLLERSEDMRRANFFELLQRMRPEDTRDVMNLIDEFEKQGRNLAFER